MNVAKATNVLKFHEKETVEKSQPVSNQDKHVAQTAKMLLSQQSSGLWLAGRC